MSNSTNTSDCVVPRNERIGLTVVAISLHEQVLVVPPAVLRLAIEASLFSEDQELGIKASREKGFTALWAGSNEERAAIRRMYNQKPDQMPRVDLASLGEFEYDWLNGPGYNAIAKHVEAGVGLVTFFCSPAEGITPLAAANLARLRQQAHQHACHVVAFVVLPDAKINVREFRGMVDRTVVIKPCEPDPEWTWAVSSEFVSQGYFDVTRSKTMCQLTSDSKGYPKAFFEPHLHDELETRVQWHMRMHGAMNKNIASVFEVSGSTITRALQHLPKYPKSWKSEEEVDALLAFVKGEDKLTVTSGKKHVKCDESDLIDDHFVNVPKKTSNINKRR